MQVENWTYLICAVLLVLILGAFFFWKYFRGKRKRISDKKNPQFQDWPVIWAGIFQAARARQKIFISCDAYFHEIWDDDQVYQAMQEAIDRGVEISICGQWFDVQAKRLARLINDGKVIFYPLNSTGETDLFLSNDHGDYVRYHARCHNGIFRTSICGYRIKTLGGHDRWPQNGSEYLERVFYRRVSTASKLEAGTFLENLKIFDPGEKERAGGEFRLTNPRFFKTASLEEVEEFIRYLEGC